MDTKVIIDRKMYYWVANVKDTQWIEFKVKTIK